MIQSVYTGEMASEAGKPMSPSPSNGMSTVKSIKPGSSLFPAHSPAIPESLMSRFDSCPSEINALN